MTYKWPNDEKNVRSHHEGNTNHLTPVMAISYQKLYEVYVKCFPHKCVNMRLYIC